MEALHDVVRAGKARYIGASSMFAWQFAKAQYTAETHGWTKFVSMQNHYNLIYREEEREMIPLCLDQGVGCIPWSPLARGVLAGNRTRDGGRHTTRSSTDPFTDYLYDQPTDFDVVDAVVEVAAAPRRAAGAGRPGLAARQAGRDGADRGVDQEEAPEGRAGRRGADAVRGRDRRAREALRAPPRARALLGGGRGGPVGSPAGWSRAREIGGGMRVALTVADFLQPGRARLRAPRGRGGRARGAGFARDAHLRRARGPGPGHGPRPRRPRGRPRGAGRHRQPELRPVPDRRSSG